MNSRIGNHIAFPDYDPDELVEIGKVMCRELEYDLAPGAAEAMRAYMAKRMTMPFFANARTVRNAIDLARMSAAIRLFNEKVMPRTISPSHLCPSILGGSCAHSYLAVQASSSVLVANPAASPGVVLRAGPALVQA